MFRLTAGRRRCLLGEFKKKGKRTLVPRPLARQTLVVIYLVFLGVFNVRRSMEKRVRNGGLLVVSGYNPKRCVVLQLDRTGQL